jgi:hypothetical protein
MSGNVYQLRYRAVLPIGTYVAVNGPYDKFGVVYDHGKFIGDPDGTLHLVRGIGSTLPAGKRQSQ